MNYDIAIIEPSNGQTLKLPHRHQLRGGTFAIGGTDHAELNVTYNYAKIFQEAFKDPDGIKTLAMRNVLTGLLLLQNAIANLSGMPDDDYWKATPGNARKALCELAALGNMVLATGKNDDAVWEIR